MMNEILYLLISKSVKNRLLTYKILRKKGAFNSTTTGWHKIFTKNKRRASFENQKNKRKTSRFRQTFVELWQLRLFSKDYDSRSILEIENWRPTESSNPSSLQKLVLKKISHILLWLMDRILEFLRILRNQISVYKKRITRTNIKKYIF